jgi:TRAP transporter 4TM/12TM fusion protein
MGRLSTGFAFLTGLSVILWTTDVLRLVFGLTLMTQEFAVWILGLTLLLTYLSRDHRGARVETPSKLSVCLGVIAVALCCYLSFRYRVMAEELYYHLEEAAIVGIVLIPLVIEALRRLVGWSLVVIVLSFLAYGLLGSHLPEPFVARPWGVPDLAAHLAWDTTAMVGLPLNIGATVVLPFILFGVVLSKAGGGDFFSDLAVATMGGLRGGSSKIAIVASALFGTISGSAVSNVASTGVISIPLMKRSGLSGRLAAATECVASTGGQLMPPVMGAAAFLMAEIAQISYQEVALAAVLPAVFFFAAVFFQADADAIRLGIEPIPISERKRTGSVLKEGWHFIPPFVVLIYTLFSLNWTPELSALAAAGTTLVLSWFRSYAGIRLDLGVTLDSIITAGRQSVEIIVIVAAAGFVIGVLNATGLVFNLALIVINLAGQDMLILLCITAAISIVLGMGMPTVAVYVLLATLVVPALVKTGIEPIAAHFFVLYFGMMSMITPPIAIAAFAAASLAEEKPLEVAVTGMRYAWLAYVIPFVFVVRPDFLLGVSGDWTEIVIVVSAVTLILLTMGSGLSGFARVRLSLVQRGSILLAGAALFVALISHQYTLWMMGLSLVVLIWVWLPRERIVVT